MSSKSSSEDSKQRRTAVVALDNFAHRKGVKKALDEFRERKEKKRVETAKALRTYQKVMKQEGYEPGKGASRKRGIEDATSEEEEVTRKKRTHMFQKPVQQAEERKRGIEQNQIEQVKNEKERKHRLRERRQRTKMLTQRTKHGQPVMKNMVHDILNKLERQKSSQP